VNRRSHDGHCLRRRMLAPSSETRESRTRESVCLQYGQNMACLLPRCGWGCGRGAHILWMTTSTPGITTYM